jgi:protein phosphatase inhibitor 2
MSEKEVTIANTHYNTGHRRSSSSARPRRSSRTPSHHAGEDGADDSQPPSQRLQWDEANLYLTEQERTATMKINEPKTPYAKHYDPNEDPSDDDMSDGVGLGEPVTSGLPHRKEDDIPGLDLGEPEDGSVPTKEEEEEEEEGKEGRTKTKGSSRHHRSVHVDDSGSGRSDDEMVGLSAEEREKHRRFEQMRKKHYEMKDVAQLLGHPEDLDDDDEEVPPPMPALPRTDQNTNGSA